MHLNYYNLKRERIFIGIFLNILNVKATQRSAFLLFDDIMLFYLSLPV